MVNAGFLSKMYPFSLCFRGIRFLASTDTKLDQMYSSITYLAVFYGIYFLSSSVSVLFCDAAFDSNHILVDLKHIQYFEISKGFLRYRFLKFFVPYMLLTGLYY